MKKARQFFAGIRKAGWLSALLACSTALSAMTWQEKMEYLVYSPRYFGPNAFPVPELLGGALPCRWEVELRGEYHTMPGDRTYDAFARLYIPIAGGKAGVTLSGVIREWYETSEAVRDERWAAETKPPIPCYGDLVLNCYYQVVRSKKWADVMVSANLKTASGGRVCDARFTDAASYWFDCQVGRNLWEDPSCGASVRLQALAGFYCWMTNHAASRQNDAFCYGIGVRGVYRHVSLDGDFAGFNGYRNNGDKPMQLRLKLEYELKKNILSFRFRHGIRDILYNSYSLAYIRCF